LLPFILNWIKRDNVISKQLLLQLRKYINCILFHVFDTIVSFYSTFLHWVKRADNVFPYQGSTNWGCIPIASFSMLLISCHSRSYGPPIGEVHQLHPITCDLLFSMIHNWIKRDNAISDQMVLQLRKYISSILFPMYIILFFPFILNWIKRDNVVSDQLLLQLRKYTNCILFHVIDKIVSFDSQSNWKG